MCVCGVCGLVMLFTRDTLFPQGRDTLYPQGETAKAGTNISGCVLSGFFSFYSFRLGIRRLHTVHSVFIGC